MVPILQMASPTLSVSAPETLYLVRDVFVLLLQGKAM